MKNKCKIYRLIDLHYPPKHENYVRYVGRTCGELRGRLREHNSSCTSGLLQPDWQGAPVFEIQLVELVDTESESKLRESFWVRLHQKAGYNLLNVKLVLNVNLLEEEIHDSMQIREEIETRIKNACFSDGYLELKQESDRRLCAIEENIYGLIGTRQVDDKGAKILLQAIGKRKGDRLNS